MRNPFRSRRPILPSGWESRVSALARYNTECANGIAHTAEYDALMRAEQEWFDAVYLPTKYPR